MSVRQTIIATLQTEGGCSATELANRLGWRPASVRAEISRIRRSGMPVQRTLYGRWREARYHLAEDIQNGASLHDELRRLSDHQLDALVGTIKAERMMGFDMS